MKIVEITVHAGRTFNHPYENYANFKPGLSLRATLSADDDVEQATTALHQQAEQMAERQKQQLLADLHQLERRSRIASTIATTERTIANLQAELQLLKQEPEQLAAPEEAEETLAFLNR